MPRGRRKLTEEEKAERVIAKGLQNPKVQDAINKAKETMPDTANNPPATTKPEPPKPKLNPPTPIILRFVCATCHTCQTMRYIDGKLTENRAYNMLTGVNRTVEGIPLIEMLCLRCGTVSWKIAPEIEDKKTLALYPNLALKRG